MYGHVYRGTYRLFFDRRDGVLRIVELACEPLMINPKCQICRGLGGYVKTTQNVTGWTRSMDANAGRG